MSLNTTEDAIRGVVSELHRYLGPHVKDAGAIDWRWLAGRVVTVAVAVPDGPAQGHGASPHTGLSEGLSYPIEDLPPATTKAQGDRSAFRVNGRIAELVKIGGLWTVGIADQDDLLFNRTPFDYGYAPLAIGDPAKLVLTWTPR